MKKNLFITTALAFLAFTACQQEKFEESDVQRDGFRVYAEDTKAVLDGVEVAFEDADAIDIYVDDATTPVVYTYSQESGLFVDSGKEANGSEYSVLFPSVSTDPSRSTINIPYRQVATVNSFPKNALYMAGVSSTKEVMLKHLMGLWEIDILPQYDGQKMVRASLKMDGGHKINGNFTIDWTDNSLTYVDGGSNAILLADIGYTMTAGESVKLYFALPEGTYDGGFTFTATMTDGTIMSKSSPSTINIRRGQITKVKNEVNYTIFDSGSGTEEDPYIIKSATQWNNMAAKINRDPSNYASAYYKLGADIDFENDATDPIDTFKGVLDGAGFTVKNAAIGDGTASHQGFFYLLAGTVKNVNFDNITVTGGSATGASSSAAVMATGNIQNAFTIENCHVTNSNIISGPHEGQNGGSYAAGLVGRCNHASAVIRNCSVNNTTISCEVANAGGIVGYVANGILENVKSSGNTITAAGQYAGGTVGNINAGNISNVESTGNTISGSRYVGGMTGGLTSATVDAVLSSGNTITSGSTYAGGVIGLMGAGTLINVVSEDNVATVKTTYCGGVVAVCSSSDGKIINVLSKGNTLKTLTHSDSPCLGLVLGTDGNKYETLLANTLVLSGTTEYTFEPNPTDGKEYAACVGIVMGYTSATIDNVYYNQNYRGRYDMVFTTAATEAEAVTTYRYAIGQKRNVISYASWSGIDSDIVPYLTTPLTNGTCLGNLNDWVEANKTTYPTLKSWVAGSDNYPTLILEDTAQTSIDPLNIVESTY